MFKRSPTVPTKVPDGKPMSYSTNLFPNGTLMDLYVYVSEDEYRPDFTNPKELIWTQKNIIYGDWTGGPNKDSTYQLDTEITCSKVGI